MAPHVFYVSPRLGVLTPSQMVAKLRADAQRLQSSAPPAVIGHTRTTGFTPAPSATRH